MSRPPQHPPLASEGERDTPPRTAGEWARLAEPTLRGRPVDELPHRTLDGFRVPAISFLEEARPDPAWPGLAPSRRGSRASGVRDGWDLRAVHAEPVLERLNAAILQDLEGGVSSIELRLAPRASRDGGEPPGVALADVEDLERALAEVDLSIAPIALDPGARFDQAARHLLELWERRGLDPAACRGALNADPLGTAARAGRLDHDPLARLGELGRAIAASHPAVTCARADSLPYHDAGAADGDELACVLATGVAYLRELTDAGVPSDRALAQISLRCALDGDFLAGLSKVRALREMWSRIGVAVLASAADADGAATAEPPPPVIEAIAGRRGLSRVDPWTNLLRAGGAMVGGALGGADVLTTLPDADALAIPSRDLARRLARNLQLVLSHEAHLYRVVDPVGGAWALEEWTERLADAAWERFQEIEAGGGMVEALRAGRVQAWVAESARRRAERAARRQDVVVGVNEYCSVADRAVGDRAVADRAVADRVVESRSGDDEPDADPAAVASGEAIEPLPLRRIAAPFERVRIASAARGEDRAGRPAAIVVLARLGAPADFAARASYVRGLLAIAGVEPRAELAAESPKELAALFGAATTGEQGEVTVVLCSSDALYAERGVAAVTELRDHGARQVVVAGKPVALEQALRDAGAGRFLAAGDDVLASLEALLGDVTDRTGDDPGMEVAR